MRRALLVCNSYFPEDPRGLPELKGPPNDALWLWRTLVSDEYGLYNSQQVQVVLERRRKDVVSACEEFFSAALETDELLLYYSGHGIMSQEELLICVNDSATSLPRATSIGTDDISKMIAASKARSVIVILDCCFSGAFKGRRKAPLGGSGRYVLSATTPTGVAQDARELGVPSPFTMALVASMTDPGIALVDDEWVDLDSLVVALEGRLQATNAPSFERDFDGSGRVKIARRKSMVEYVGNTPVADEVSQKPVTHVQPAKARRLGRLVGDLTVADLFLWRVYGLMGLTVIAGSFVQGWYVLHLDYSWFGDSAAYWVSLGQTVAGTLFGVVATSSALIERRWQSRARAEVSRRLAVREMESQAAVVASRIKTVLIAMGLAIAVTLPFSYSAGGFAWIVAIACMGGVVLLSVFERTRLGDAAVIAAASLLIGGNVTPIYVEFGFFYGLDHWSGWLSMIIGLAVAAMWWLRTPRQTLILLLGFGILVQLASPQAYAMREGATHWVVATVGVALLAVTAVLGAARPLGMGSDQELQTVRENIV